MWEGEGCWLCYWLVSSCKVGGWGPGSGESGERREIQTTGQGRLEGALWGESPGEDPERADWGRAEALEPDAGV